MKNLLILMMMVVGVFACTKYDEYTSNNQTVVQLTDSSKQYMVFNNNYYFKISDTTINNNTYGIYTNIGGDTILFNNTTNTVVNAPVTVNVTPPTVNVQYVDSSTLLVQVAGSTYQAGDIYLTNNIAGDSITLTNNNIVQGDSLYIPINVCQATCPYPKERCIIKNCRFHHPTEYKKNHGGC